jgi:hypothetical protein
MAVGAGSPELKLSVGFDLNYFRGQLTTLGAAASSYHLPINIKFDRLGIQEEFNKLGRNISGRQYNLKVEIKSLGVASEQARSLKENLEALTKIKFAVDTSAIGDAKDALKALRGEAATAVKNAQSVASNAGAVNGPAIKQRTIRQGLSALSTEDVAAQYKKAAETGIIAYNEAITKNRTKMVREIGKVADAVSAGFASKGSSEFSSKAKADAEAYIKGLEKDLEIASPSKRTQRIGEQTSDGFWLGLIKGGAKWERAAAADLRARAVRVFQSIDSYAKNKALDLTVAVQVEFEVQAGALAKFGSNLAISATKSVKGALVKAGEEGLSTGVSSAIGSVASPGGLAMMGAGSVAAGGWESITTAIDLAKNILSGSPAKETLLGSAVKVAELVIEHGAEGALITAAGLAGVGFAGGAAKGFTSSLVTQGITAAAQLTVTQVGVRVVDGLKGVPSVVGNAFKSLPGQVNALALKGRTDIGGLTDGSTYALFKETTGNFVNAAVEQGRLFSEKNAPRIAAALGTGISVGGRAVGRGVAAGGRAVGAGVAAGWEDSLEQRISLLSQALAKVNQGIDFLDNVLIKGAVDIQGLTDGTTIAATKQALLGYKAVLEIGAAQLMDFHAALQPGNIERVAVSEMVRSQGERVAGQRLLPPIGQSSAGIRRQYRPPNVVPAGGFSTHGATPVGGFPSDGPAQLSFIQRMFRKAAPPAAAYSNFGYGGFGGGGGTASGGFGGFGGAGGGGPYGGFGYGGFGGGGGGSGGGGNNPPMGPASTQLGAGYHTVNKGLSAIGNAYSGAKGFLNTARFPVSGAISQLGGEFGNAVKQVLLFGTAYKAIAFLQNVPGEAFNAAKGLATYKNQLQAITAESGTFEQSFAFVEGLAQRFNVPLESARQGFVRLYASMQPAGFDQGQIESLFTGISQSAAAFGLSSDQVDRVTNAFSQMASKGQIMAEEVKGQLGDVLPGALSLFAKAAQMSLPEFTKAMEDGAFKGKAMAAVLDNVGVLLSGKFGAAAQGAAKTLQGAVNQINNNLRLMYESLTPVVNNIAAAFGPEINNLIKDVTSTVQVLTSTFTSAGEGFNTLTPRAQGFYLAVKQLEPSIRAAGASIADLAGRFATLLPAVVNAISLAISFAASPLGRAAVLAAAGIATLTAAFKLLEVTGLEAAIKSVYRYIASLTGFTQATGVARVAAIGLRLALTGIVIGGLLMGLDFLVGKILEIGGAADKSKQEVAGLKKTLDEIAGSGRVEDATKVYMEANTKAIVARAKYKLAAENAARYEKGKAGAAATSPENQMGVAVMAGNMQEAAKNAYDEMIRANQYLRDARKTRDNAVAIAMAGDKQTQAALKPIPPSGEDDKKKKTSLESYHSLQDALAKNFTQAELDRQDALHQDAVDRINAQFDLRDARANSFQREAIKFERQMSDIDLKRQKALLEASKEVLKAQGSVAGGALPGGMSATGATGLLQGSTGISGGAHFDVRKQDGSYLSQSQARALFDSSVAKQLTMTSPYGPRTAPVPGASTYHRGVDLAGPANTPLNLAAGYSMVGAGEKGGLGYAASVRGPDGTMYDVGHLQRPAAGARAPGKVLASEKRDEVAIQKTQLALAQQSLAVQIANAQAVRESAIAWAQYTASIAPVEEQKLQNSLLEKKGQLMKSGLSDDVIEKQMKQFETEEKTALAVSVVNKMVTEKKMKAEEATKKIAELTANMIAYNDSLDANLVLQRQQQFDASISSLNKQLELAGIIDPRAEQRQKYIQEGLTPGQADEKVRLEEQLAAVTRLRDGYRGLADSIGGSFGQAFKGVISGSMTAREALAGFFQSVADSFLDMVAQMIAAWMRTMLLQGFQSLFGPVLGGMGGGFKFPGTTGLGTNFSSAIGNSTGFPFYFANGGIAPGGFRAFASGGVVTGPTLGLVGEGRYNEAVIPLPDGKSVPVNLRGGSNGNNGPVNVVVNVDAKGSTVEGDEDKANELGRAISAAVQSELIKQQRPGGMLSGPRR